MASAATLPPQLDELSKLCPTTIKPGETEYAQQGSTWSTAAERHPQLVVVPPDLATLSKVIKQLYDSKLDFCIRNTGVGGSSASDVCISMQAFKEFHVDAQTETATIGAGFNGEEVDAIIEKQAPGYAVMTARCNFVGIAGSALWGGLSWLSNEYGLENDPQNLLDMQIVLGDGRVIWATEDPELMWALRGGGANFGAVTALKVKIRKVEQKIFHGAIMVPYTSLHECSKAIAKMGSGPGDPKMAMHVFLQGVGTGMPDQGARPGIAILPYDAHGEAHARSEDGFAWAFRLPGAQEFGCKEMTLREINAAAATFGTFKGVTEFYLSAPMLETLEEDTVVNIWKWYEDFFEEFPTAGKGSTIGLEYLQKGAWGSSLSRDATAFPHGEGRHMVQIMIGCPSDDIPSNFTDISQKHLKIAGEKIVGKAWKGEYCPGFLQEWNDVRQTFGENFQRLLAVKMKYDASNRFNKGPNLMQKRVN